MAPKKTDRPEKYEGSERHSVVLDDVVPLERDEVVEIPGLPDYDAPENDEE